MKFKALVVYSDGRLGQGGISLPDRDYYLKSDTRSKTVQGAKKVLIATFLVASI
jgi:putative endopeptidase